MDLSDNPCRRVSIPKGSKKERKILTIEETEKFFELLKTAPLKYQAFFILDIYSGLRRGEMLSLEWKDIDFQTGVIHVQRTSNYTKARGIYTDTTKTESSVRYVKVPMEIVELLRTYKAEQDQEKAEVGDKWHENDRLFVKWDGRPMQNGTPYFWLGEFCEKHDLPFYGLHSFRHLFCSLLVNQGVDIVTVSGAMGHSTVSTTVLISYGHTYLNIDIFIYKISQLLF